VTKSDFIDWKHNVVTQQVFGQLEDRVRILVEEIIAQTAFMSQAEMAEKCGAVKAFRDVLSIEFDEESHD